MLGRYIIFAFGFNGTPEVHQFKFVDRDQALLHLMEIDRDDAIGDSEYEQCYCVHVDERGKMRMVNYRHSLILPEAITEEGGVGFIEKSRIISINGSDVVNEHFEGIEKTDWVIVHFPSGAWSGRVLSVDDHRLRFSIEYKA